MRTRTPIRAALAAAPLLLTAPFAAAQDAAEVLVSEGDVLANGWTVAFLGDHGLADDGRWAAIVRSTETAADANDALLIDGTLVAAEGSSFGSETIAFMSDLSVGPAGEIALIYTVQNPSGSTDTLSRLVLQGALLLSEDDVVSASGIPAGSTIHQINGVSVDLPKLMVSMQLRAPSGTLTTYLISYDVVGGALASPTVVAEVGAVVGGLAGPIEVIFSGFAVDSSGEYMASVSFDAGGTTEYAILRNGSSYMENGTSGLLVNSTWETPTAHDVAQRGGNEAASGQIRISNGDLIGIILDRAGRVIQEGEGLPVGTIGDFLYCDVDVTENGVVAYVAPLTNGREVLAIEKDPVLLAHTSRASGRLITDIPYNFRNVVQVSGNARWMTCRVTLDGTDDALVRVDRSIGDVGACTVVPNSTGMTGHLTAIGSAQVAFESLTITADQLPTSSFGYLITSKTPGFVANPGGSAGNICLGGDVGRYIAQVASSGSAGRIRTVIDLEAMPQPTATVPVLAGERWHFQLWHRDAGMGGMPTSNFTEMISIDFQ